VAFVDAFSGETFLRLQCNEEEIDLIAFRLYDKNGDVTADSDGLHQYRDGLTICDSLGEILLLIPTTRQESVQYRIYNTLGSLITCSDGKRTQLYAGVRIEGNRPLPGRPPGQKAS
jgi:hypothetical protein